MLLSWFKKVSLLVVAGIIAIGGTELFTKALMPQNRDTVLDILVPDETVGYIYEANVTAEERGRDYSVEYVTNSLGLRDREYSANDTTAFQVLLVGNSFCVSHGLDIKDSLSRALERNLIAYFATEGVGRPVEVINVSNAGYTPFNYWRCYARWAPVFKPDAVVVGFVCAREHRCDPENTRFLVQNGLLRARYLGDRPPVIPSRSPVTLVRKTLARNSDFYVLLRNFFYYNERVGRVLGHTEEQGEASQLLAPYRLSPPKAVTEGRLCAFDYLDRLRDETSRDHVTFLVLGIPQKSDVVDSSWESTQRLAQERDWTVSRTNPADALVEHCESAGIEVINLAPVMERMGAIGFFEYDNHWNEIGVAASAKEVAMIWGPHLTTTLATHTLPTDSRQN